MGQEREEREDRFALDRQSFRVGHEISVVDGLCHGAKDRTITQRFHIQNIPL